MSPLKTILLTGASTGLGLAITRQLLQEPGYRFILTARASSLQRFAEEGIVESETLRLRALDVTSAEERKSVVEEALRDWDGVDILINNAGISYRAVVEHVRDIDRLEQMDINFRSPMEMARLVLPRMREKRWGRIINVSSVGGMMAMPTMAVYSASKFALEGASEALWYEVKPWNVRVSLVEPGFIRSDGFQKVRLTELSRAAIECGEDPYTRHYAEMSGFIEKVMNLTFATPDSVARAVLKTMKRKRPPLRVSGTIDAVLFDLFRRVVPRRLYHWLLYKSLPHIRRWGPSSETDHQKIKGLKDNQACVFEVATGRKPAGSTTREEK
jgi:short-subunit dehydrogenase